MNSMDIREDNNRFNCPIDGCVYGINGDKYFKRKLLLTQHIANKHSEKKFSCDKCQKKYAIEWQLKYHHKWCGFQWRCGSCDKSYTERLSLVMHCKRRSHLLPENSSTKRSKTRLNCPPISVQLIVMPLILNSSSSSGQTLIQSNVGQNHKLLNILPKNDSNSDELNERSDCWTQTNGRQECNECKTKNSLQTIETKTKKCVSMSTQTERLSEKSLKSRESRSTDCQTIRKRNRKPQTNNNYESIETQTLESTLHSTGSSIKICASTSTSPPKKSRRKCLDINKTNDNVVNLVKKSCAFTQTVGQSSTSTATATEGSEMFFIDFNPLLSQTDSSNAILEQSVQTEANDISFDNVFNNIETQTVNLEINTNNLLDFSADEEFLFSDLEFTDIETQTIWNNDRMTQTDEHLDQINDVILRYLDNDSGCDISDRTLFADTQTQTQSDFPLICSSVQTSQPFT